MSGILAQYDSLGATRQAIERLRSEGHEQLDVFTPVMSPELEEALGIESSPVRRWALIGGITGFVTALALTSLTALAYPIVTQGKPIVSLPAFFIIMFEMTILFSGLFGFAGVLFHTRKPARRLSPHYRPAFSNDRFGIFVPAVGATEADRVAIERLLRESGAVEVEVSE
jgi:hypothetical protein